MDAENKLQEMCDRGWHLKVSRQKSSATWDVVGALDGWLLREGQVFSTYGIHTSLISALLDMEQMLIDAEIQNCIEHQKGGIDQDQKYYSSRLQSMRSIKKSETIMPTFPLLFGSEPTETKIKEFAGSLLSLGSENSLELARLLLALEAKYHSSLHEDLTEFEVFVKTAISVSNTYGLQSFQTIEDQFVEFFDAIAKT